MSALAFVGTKTVRESESDKLTDTVLVQTRISRHKVSLLYLCSFHICTDNPCHPETRKRERVFSLSSFHYLLFYLSAAESTTSFPHFTGALLSTFSLSAALSWQHETHKKKLCFFCNELSLRFVSR